MAPWAQVIPISTMLYTLHVSGVTTSINLCSALCSTGSAGVVDVLVVVMIRSGVE